ncbi:MAG: acetyltransferase [Actinomycetota bacterium]|nr:acetyltransferase [Actinomycetota bacterium]
MAVAVEGRVAPRKLGYQPSLDGLRAISVLAVILYHAGATWMPGGFLGVEVFFVVSGFLITTLLLEERSQSGAVDMRHFWVRRARRLLPAVYLLLAVVSGAALLVYRDAAGRMGGDVIAALLYVSNWWQIFLDESYFVQSGRPPLLMHLWSLAVEEQFYLIFPPLFVLGLAKLGRQRTRTVVLVVALASAVEMALLFDEGADTSRIYYGTDTRAAGLLIGVLLAMVWTPWTATRPAARRAGPTLDLIGGVGLVVIGWFMVRVNAYDPFIYRGGFLLLDLVCIAVIAVLVHPATRLSSVMGWTPLVWVGMRSYALYLWHWPIFQVTRPDQDVPLSGLPLFVLRMALTFGAAELSYRYVEQPLRKGVLGDWWRDVRTATGARREALVRRGMTVGGVFAVLLIMLTVGLYGATHSPEREQLAMSGLEDAAGFEDSGIADPGDDPDAPVTTDVTTTTTTTQAPVTTAPAPGVTTTAPAATTAPPAQGTDAVAVGDSVMLGASGALTSAMPGMRVDAKVGRQFDSVLNVVGWYAGEGLIPGPLVVHAGTNGTFTDGDLDRLMDIAGDRKVLLVNARVARPWQDLVNQRLAAAAQRHPNAVLVDWYSLASAHPEWFANDGAHLTSSGAAAFAELIRSNL